MTLFQDTQGGALVNLIHSYTANGDPFVRKFTDQLLEEVSMCYGQELSSGLADGSLLIEVSKPFFETLQKWLFSGELHDPYLEFFVTVNPELAHLQYVYPSSLTTGMGIMIGDSAFSAFNADQDDLTGERESGLRLWQGKYKFRQEMLPAFVGEGFGSKVCHPVSWITGSR